MKQIDGNGDVGSFLHGSPKSFHLSRAVDIVDNHQAVWVKLWPKLPQLSCQGVPIRVAGNDEIQRLRWQRIAHPINRMGGKPFDQPLDQPCDFIAGFFILLSRIDHLIHQPIDEGRMGSVARVGRQEMVNIIKIKPKSAHRAKDTGNRDQLWFKQPVMHRK